MSIQQQEAGVVVDMMAYRIAKEAYTSRLPEVGLALLELYLDGRIEACMQDGEILYNTPMAPGEKTEMPD